MRVFLCLFCLTCLAQDSQHVQLEAGYQSVDVDGNVGVFESQNRIDEGIVLRHFSFEQIRHDRMLNQFSVHMSGFDADKNGRFSFKAKSAKRFYLNLNYQNLRHVNILPEFANPFLEDGIIPGQHTFDRDRSILDLELVILPDRMFSPIIRYSNRDLSGLGTSTYHFGQDEFVLQHDLDETSSELQLGGKFKLQQFSGELFYTIRDQEEQSDFRLAGDNIGNNLREVLGQQIAADQLTRDQKYDRSFPGFNFSIQGPIHQRVRIAAAYVQSDIESELEGNNRAAGNFASFSIARFFSSWNQSVNSEVDGDQYLAKTIADIELPKGFYGTISYQKSNYNLSGNALLDAVYQDVTTFGHQDAAEVLTSIDANNERSQVEETMRLNVQSPRVSGFQLKLGFETENRSLTLSPDLAEILVPGGQGGDFDRSIDHFKVEGSFKSKHHEAVFEYESRDADQVIFRTDYLDSSQFGVRLKSRWSKSVRWVASGTWVDRDDDERNFHSELQRLGIDGSFRLHKSFNAELHYGVYEVESDIQIIVPQTFEQISSLHREDGREWIFNFMWEPKKWVVQGNWTQYEAEGVLGLELNRLLGSATFEFQKHFGLTLELSQHEYQDMFLDLANYDADVATLIFHYKK